MLTTLDFVQAGKQLKTACGWEFEVQQIDQKSDYPISGYVRAPSGVKMLYRFDRNGYPENLPTTHGLNLVPVVTIQTQRMIDPKTMKCFNSVDELILSEVNRISNAR